MQQSNAMGDKYSFHLSCLFLLASLLTPYIPTYYSTYPYVNDRLSFYERQEFPFFITDEMARCGASLPWWTSPPVSTVNCTFLFLDLMRCRGFTPFYKEWRVLYYPPPSVSHARQCLNLICTWLKKEKLRKITVQKICKHWWIRIRCV